MVGKELAGLVVTSYSSLIGILMQQNKRRLCFSEERKEITLLDVTAATDDEPQINCYTEDEGGSSRFGASDELLKNYEFVHEIVTHYFDSVTIWTNEQMIIPCI